MVGRARHRASSQVLGTPHYLPPEQAAGKRGKVGPWSDIYGLGAILYYLLTGRPPFQAEELTEVLDQVLHQEPVSPRLLNGSVPRDLDTICLKCLEKEPDRRYGSAQALAADLGRYLHGETILARPVSALEKGCRWCQRKPGLAAALTACVVALVTGMAGIAWQWRRAEAESLVARRSLYDSDMLLAQQALAEDNFGRVEQLLRKHDPLWSGQPAEDLRGWEWSWLRNQIKSDESFTLGSHSNTVTYLTFSSDGRWLASVSHYAFGNDVKIWDLQKRRCAATLPLNRAQALNSITFSPHDHSLLVADPSRLTIYAAPDWRKPARDIISDGFQAIAFSGDGRLLVGLEGHSPFRVRVMNARSFDTIDSWPAVAGRTLGVSPDGRYAAVQSLQEAEIVVYDLATGAQLVALPGPGNQYRLGDVRFSPESRILASVVYSGADEIEKRVDFWSVPHFRLIQRLQQAGSHFSSVTFSPDGRFVYLASGNQSIAVYDLATWAAVHTFHGHRDEIRCIALSPDGRWLASGSRDQTIRFWSSIIQPEAPTSWALPSATREVYLANDGQRLATVMTNHVVRVWSITNFQALAEWSIPFTNRLRSSHGKWTRVALAPGGARLAVAGEPASGQNGDTASLAGWELPSRRETLEYRGLRTGPAGQALIWEAHTGRHLGSLTNIPGGSGLLKFSPRDTWLAARLDEGTTCGFQIGLWKQPWTACERLLAKPGHHVTDMAFSPDEQFLATAGEDGSVCLWAVRTGRRVADLKGRLNCFTAVAWSPSGDRLLGGGEDGTITIWDTTSHQEVGRLLGHQKPIRGLAFSQDGGGIVSVSLESLRIWRASPLACFAG